MNYQVQPRDAVALRTVPASQVQQEIKNFRRALDSYPARVAKDPGVNFQQHLCSFFATTGDDRRAHRSRRQ